MRLPCSPASQAPSARLPRPHGQPHPLGQALYESKTRDASSAVLREGDGPPEARPPAPAPGIPLRWTTRAAGALSGHSGPGARALGSRGGGPVSKGSGRPQGLHSRVQRFRQWESADGGRWAGLMCLPRCAGAGASLCGAGVAPFLLSSHTGSAPQLCRCRLTCRHAGMAGRQRQAQGRSAAARRRTGAASTRRRLQAVSDRGPNVLTSANELVQLALVQNKVLHGERRRQGGQRG